MRGFRTYLCPGCKLAQLDVLLFLVEVVFAKFAHELVEGQPTNGLKYKLRLVLEADAAASFVSFQYRYSRIYSCVDELLVDQRYTKKMQDGVTYHIQFFPSEALQAWFG